MKYLIITKKIWDLKNFRKLGKNFINNDNVALMLGDNIFYGQGLVEIIAKTKTNLKGARIFSYPVRNPKDFGVVELKKNKIIKLVEKPKKTKSNLAITGLYFFDKNRCEAIFFVFLGLKSPRSGEIFLGVFPTLAQK